MTLDHGVDHYVARLLAPLAFWVLLNGIDDLIIDIAGLFSAIRNKRAPTEQELDAAPPRRMAIFVALWHEHKVIQRMIDSNVTKLRYPHADFFIGVYPNDAPTIASVREAMKRYPTVHLSICPHDGPTSKADNLNWIYQRMLVHEEQHGVRFEMILTHDAEDLMDPDALRWINYYAQWNDMVQIPVLALPTPLRELTHGVYCDEFAEFQFKDMPARQTMGGFIPSNGVGTGFSRRALEMIAEAHSNRIFEPACLTEDYENGFRIKRLGLPQYFIPIHFRLGRPIATREYFPRKLLTAVRQRTRWTMGIGLQSWEFHSTRETLDQLYWFWRDRKSLVGNLVAPITNLLTLLGGATWIESHATHTPWGLAQDLSRLYPLYVAGLAMQAIQTAIRIWCSAKVYGSRFAAGVPVRVLTANIINCVATLRAICMYGNAKLHRRPLRWVKTEHAFPQRAALQTERKPLGEILSESHGLTTGQVEDAAASQPAGVRLGEHLVRIGLIGEEDLYSALSRQNSVPRGIPDGDAVSLPVTRAIPAALARKLRMLPFRIAAGELYVAGPDLPGEAAHEDIRRFSSLDIRFHLVTPAEFEELADQYLLKDTNPREADSQLFEECRARGLALPHSAVIESDAGEIGTEGQGPGQPPSS